MTPVVARRPTDVHYRIRDRSMSSNQSPIEKPSRRIKPRTSLFLYTRAGGRCEFDGCNAYLLEHSPTETPENFAEQAHIYGFKEKAARGSEPGRPAVEEINEVDNVMLLCPTCHHQVDQVAPQDYTVETLRRFKRDHEARVFDLTATAKDRDTVPILLKGLIAGRPVDVSDEEMQSAAAPNYIKWPLGERNHAREPGACNSSTPDLRVRPASVRAAWVGRQHVGASHAEKPENHGQNWTRKDDTKLR